MPAVRPSPAKPLYEEDHADGDERQREQDDRQHYVVVVDGVSAHVRPVAVRKCCSVAIRRTSHARGLIGLEFLQ